jgi:hypothetical protein
MSGNNTDLNARLRGTLVCGELLAPTSLKLNQLIGTGKGSVRVRGFAAKS